MPEFSLAGKALAEMQQLLNDARAERDALRDALEAVRALIVEMGQHGYDDTTGHYVVSEKWLTAAETAVRAKVTA